MARKKNPNKVKAILEGRNWYVGSMHHCGGVIRSLKGVCRYCEKYGEYVELRNKLKREAYKTEEGKRAARNRRYLNEYGISLNEYEAMLKEQNDVCAICEQKDPMNKALAVDHCHSTGKVRGLLCSFCNTALGKFKDDTRLLEKAVLYLERNHLSSQHGEEKE